MNEIQPIRPPAPGLAAMLGDIVSLLLVVAVAGPPVLFIAAPWVLVALMLCGPFAVALALVAALATAAVLVACTAALVATPYLVLRRRRAPHASVVAPRVLAEVAA